MKKQVAHLDELPTKLSSPEEAFAHIGLLDPRALDGKPTRFPFSEGRWEFVPANGQRPVPYPTPAFFEDIFEEKGKVVFHPNPPAEKAMERMIGSQHPSRVR